MLPGCGPAALHGPRQVWVDEWVSVLCRCVSMHKLKARMWGKVWMPWGRHYIGTNGSVCEPAYVSAGSAGMCCAAVRNTKKSMAGAAAPAL